MSHRWSAYTLPLSALKGGSKSDFFAFQYKSTGDRLKRCQLRSPVSAINIWWSAAILIIPPRDRRQMYVAAIGRVEEIIWLTYDAGLSAAAETLVRILKRVIVSPAVYPRFLEIAEFARSVCHSWATCIPCTFQRSFSCSFRRQIWRWVAKSSKTWFLASGFKWVGYPQIFGIRFQIALTVEHVAGFGWVLSGKLSWLVGVGVADEKRR